MRNLAWDLLKPKTDVDQSMGVLNCHNLKSEIIKRILCQNIKKLYLFAICSMYYKRKEARIRGLDKHCLKIQ